MISMEALAAWAALAFVLTITPGPDTFLVAGHAVRRGAGAGLSAVGGITAGGVFYAAVCGLGFLSALAAVPALYWTVKLLGAAYLAVIGVLMVKDALKPQADPAAPHGPKITAAPFRQGLLTNTLNPKVALFYLAVLPQFAGRGPDAPWIGVLLVAIHYAVAAVWLSGVALAAARAGSVLKRSAAAQWLQGAIGLFFVGVAGRLALERR